MTVNELIDHLKQLVEDDPTVGEFRVVMSTDGEGNSYSELAGIGVGHATGDQAWNLEYTDDEAWDSEKEWDPEFDEPYPGDNCITVWPT
jgi:hypothetical protein